MFGTLRLFTFQHLFIDSVPSGVQYTQKFWCNTEVFHGSDTVVITSIGGIRIYITSMEQTDEHLKLFDFLPFVFYYVAMLSIITH